MEVLKHKFNVPCPGSSSTILERLLEKTDTFLNIQILKKDAMIMKKPKINKIVRFEIIIIESPPCILNIL